MVPELGDLIGIDGILSFLAFLATLAPGFILIFGRSVFIAGRIRAISEAAAEYVILSSVYYALALPIFIWQGSLSWVSLSVLLFIAPAVLGLILGLLAQRGYLRNLFARVGIAVVGNQSTAWEATFAQLRGGVWVTVSLTDGRQFWGYMGGRSHAARDLEYRDIFIEHLTDSNWNSIEGPERSRGLWISGSQITMIELIED